MGYGKQCKELMAKETEDILSKPSDNIIVTSYERINNREIEKLRRNLRNLNARIFVVKKSVVKFALQKKRETELQGLLNGLAPRKTVALALGQDAAGLCKALSDFKKEHEEFFLEKGIVEGHCVHSAAVLEIARLPSKEILRRQVVWTIKSPAVNLVNSLSGITRKLVWALQAIKEAKHDDRN